MLVLARKLGDEILIGEALVRVLAIGTNHIKLGIEAPREIPIVRPDARPKFKSFGPGDHGYSHCESHRKTNQ